MPEEVVPLLVHKGDPLRYRVSCNFRDVGHLGDADEGAQAPLAPHPEHVHAASPPSDPV